MFFPLSITPGHQVEQRQYSGVGASGEPALAHVAPGCLVGIDHWTPTALVAKHLPMLLRSGRALFKEAPWPGSRTGRRAERIAWAEWWRGNQTGMAVLGALAKKKDRVMASTGPLGRNTEQSNFMPARHVQADLFARKVGMQSCL